MNSEQAAMGIAVPYRRSKRDAENVLVNECLIVSFIFGNFPTEPVSENCVSVAYYQSYELSGSEFMPLSCRRQIVF